MNPCLKDWLDIILKTITASGVVFAALNYWGQSRTKRAEWLRTLFEKFYEKPDFKLVRRWIESGEIENKIDTTPGISDDDEKLADYLNFFEFIATLKTNRRLKMKDVLDMFDFYLKDIKRSPKCLEWINREDYGFEKLRNLLNKI